MTDVRIRVPGSTKVLLLSLWRIKLAVRCARNPSRVIAAISALLVCASVGAATIEDTAPPHGCDQVGQRLAEPATQATRANSTPAFPPAQLEIRTLFEPTSFPSAGRNYLIYELHLRNLADQPVVLKGMEIVAADAIETPIVRFAAEQLVPLLRLPKGGTWAPADEGSDFRQIASGQSVVAFLCLAFDRGVAVPTQLRHRVLLADAVAQGPVIGTNHGRLRVLGPPVAGADWRADGGPGNHSHHRLGLLIAGDGATIARRYAIDWKQVKDDATFAGNALDPRSYYAYGEDVLAVAEGTVVAAKDGLPDNVPRTAAGFNTAIPITMETIGGNFVVLDLGNGQFADYVHLQAGSVLVKVGDRVQRGQVLARIGNSGDAREPHLHFQVADTPSLLASEGVPYVIDQYRVKLADGSWDQRTHELPLGGTSINFEPAQERK